MSTVYGPGDVQPQSENIGNTQSSQYSNRSFYRGILHLFRDVRGSIVVCHDPRDTEEPKEKRKAVTGPSGTVNDLNKRSMSVVLLFLHDGERDNNCQCRSDIKEGVILLSGESRGHSTDVIRASHAVFRVFSSPWKRIIPMKTATSWSFVGAYAKSVLKEAAARIISATISNLNEMTNRRQNQWTLSWQPVRAGLTIRQTTL